MIEGLQVFHIRKDIYKGTPKGASANTEPNAHQNSTKINISASKLSAQALDFVFAPQTFDLQKPSSEKLKKLEAFHSLQALPENFQPFVLNFETCLRQIWVVAGNFSSHQQTFKNLEEGFGVEVFKGAAAHKFILQIICGLDSPVVGETEVFGQFKEQVLKKIPNEHKLLTWANQIVSEAKEIRRKYLLNLGSQSYGSYCRKVTAEMSRVDILGLGSFAQSLLPWLEKKETCGKVFTRKPQCFFDKDENGNLLGDAKIKTKFKITATAQWGSDFKELLKEKSALIICAPISSQDYDFSAYDLILDLRETSQKDPLNHDQIITLQDVFKEIQKGSDYALEQKSEALKEVQKIIEKYQQQIHLRPFGWDDICA